ncbi:hypothetical protein BJ546DRAFT_964497 [Cryomyces antarcticus]
MTMTLARRCPWERNERRGWAGEGTRRHWTLHTKHTHHHHHASIYSHDLHLRAQVHLNRFISTPPPGQHFRASPRHQSEQDVVKEACRNPHPSVADFPSGQTTNRRTVVIPSSSRPSVTANLLLCHRTRGGKKEKRALFPLFSPPRLTPRTSFLRALFFCWTRQCEL